MILLIDGHHFRYETENLCNMFFPLDKAKVIEGSHTTESNYILTRISQQGEKGTLAEISLCMDGANRYACMDIPKESVEKEAEYQLCALLYQVLSEFTGKTLSWGMLTGVRPVKLVRAMREEGMDDSAILHVMQQKHFVSENKAKLCLATCDHETPILQGVSRDSFSLYVSIPFCPSRCHYCSFVSQAVGKQKKLIPEYVHLLCKELQKTGEIVKTLGLRLDTVYFGGGTPTTLSPAQLDEVLSTVERFFDLSTCKEYTVEAGRPDTIDEEKLRALRAHGISRISINPQTLEDRVLEQIGRRHTAKQFFEAFDLARKLGFTNINTDVIAGLMGDTLEGFQHTLSSLMQLVPENVTVHTLSVKRAATLSQTGGYAAVVQNEDVVPQMVDYAQDTLFANGYHPYYLYRQKNMLDNLENVGYAKGDTDGLYNVYIMDETHTILAAGAGGVTKMKNQDNGYIERIFNFKFPHDYGMRFDEILQRKEQVIPFYEKYL